MTKGLEEGLPIAYPMPLLAPVTTPTREYVIVKLVWRFGITVVVCWEISDEASLGDDDSVLCQGRD